MIAIDEFGDRPIKAGCVPSGCFSAGFVVGCFDTTDAMRAASGRYKGHTALSVDASG